MRRLAPPLALAVFFLAGAIFRLMGVNWDSGQHLHPDERFITMVETDIRWPKDVGQYFDSATSPLSPYNRGYPTFIYGTLPLFFTKFVGDIVGKSGYDGIYLVGRVLSALFDLGSVVLIFFIGKQLFSRRVGLLAAALLSVTVLHIQYSHFFVFDTTAVFFVLLAFYFAVKIAKYGRWPDYVLAGLAFGMALATKASVYPFAIILFLAALLRYLTSVPGAPPKTEADGPPASTAREKGVLVLVIRKPVLGLGLALLFTFLAFRLFQPYAFSGPNIWDILPSEKFIRDLASWKGIMDGLGDYPPSHQWTNTTPYIFPLRNLLLWGTGLPLGIAAFLGLALGAYHLLRFRDTRLLLPLVWVGFNIFYYGSVLTKTMRYLMPIYPLLALMAAFLLIWLWDKAREYRRRPRFGARYAVGAAGLFVVLVMGATLLWAYAFSQIYTRPVTRVAASAWIYENVPPGTVVANEHWDDPLPLRILGKDSSIYPGLMLELYNDEDERKWEIILDRLDRADYLFITSNRLYGSIPRLPMRYPITTEYYRLLFSGELGFQQIKTFTSYPNLFGWEINDDEAEEAFTVYDHPKVLIFKKVDFAKARARELLAQAPTDSIRHLTPRQAEKNGLMLRDADLPAYEAGGTWSQMFRPDGLANRLPPLTWLLAVELISLAALPLGFWLFASLSDRGYLLSKALGILIVAYVPWLLASFKVMPHSQITILLALLLLALVSGGLYLRDRKGINAFLRRKWPLLAGGEALFLAAFLLFYAIRVANPDLWHPYRGGEKPMDFAYLNAVIKSEYMPPYDPWYAGGYLNYYYYGQLIVATLIKLTGIVPSVAYNLAVPLLFALLVGGAFSVVYNLAHSRRRTGREWLPPVVAGLLAALFVAVLGNLDGIVQLVQGLQRVSTVQADSPIPGLGAVQSVLGGLWQVLAGGKDLPPFDFWRSSRMMPPQISITEFPFFTVLFADLHAHLIALPFTVLAIGIALALAHSGKGRLGLPLVIALGFVLGALRATNTWDFPTYFLLGAAALFIAEYGQRRRLNMELVGWLALKAAVLYLASSLFYLPFSQNFQQFYGGVRLADEKTPLYQYLGIHGLFLFAVASLIVYRARHSIPGLGPRRPAAATPEEQSGLSEPAAGESSPPRPETDAPPLPWGHAWLLVPLALALLVLGYATVSFLLLVLVGIVALARHELRAVEDPACGKEGPSAPDLFMLSLVGLAVALGIGVDLLTLKGDIARMNTVFKFYLQAWVLWALASAYAGWWLIGRFSTRGGLLRRLLGWKILWLGALLMLVAMAAIYPLAATPVRVRDRFAALPPTADGMAYMTSATYQDEKGPIELRWDEEAIRWLQENVAGSPVVLDGNAPPYRWGSRVSVYTGLPTVIGWDWHQKQQRWGYPGVVDRRVQDVATIYTSPDPALTLKLLKKYDVRYVYLGQVERLYYPGQGLAKFDALLGKGLEMAHENPEVRIYKVVD